MGGSLKEDLGRQCLHSIDSYRGLTSNKGEQPVPVVKVKRVRKAGQEGVKSEEGPTARLQHLLSTALKQGGLKDGVFQWSSMSWPLKEPEGALR